MPIEIKKQQEEPKTSGEALVYKEFMDALADQLKSPSSRKTRKTGSHRTTIREPEKTQTSK